MSVAEPILSINLEEARKQVMADLKHSFFRWAKMLIASALLSYSVVTSSASSFGSNTTPAMATQPSVVRQYFDEGEVTGIVSSRSFGKYYACVFTKRVAGKANVSFEVYFPDSDQVVYVDSAPASEISLPDGKRKLEFHFTDNWGNTGTGTLTDADNSKVVLSLNENTVVTNPRGRNAIRQYGDYKLSVANCKPTGHKLLIHVEQ